MELRVALAQYGGYEDADARDWSGDRSWVAEVTVLEHFRGEVQGTIKVHTTMGSCGIPFVEGYEYLVFAHRYEEPRGGEVFWTIVCDSTVPIEYADTALSELRDLIGTPTNSAPPRVSQHLTPPVMAYLAFRQMMPALALAVADLVALLVLAGLLGAVNAVARRRVVNAWLASLAAPMLVTMWALSFFYSHPWLSNLTQFDRGRILAVVLANAIPALLLGYWRGADPRRSRQQLHVAAKQPRESDRAG